MKTLVATALALALLGSVATTAQADEPFSGYREGQFEQRDHDRNDDRHRDGDHDRDDRHDFRNDSRRDDRDNDHDSDHRGDDRREERFDRHDDHYYDNRRDHWWHRERHEHDWYEHGRYEHDRYDRPPGYGYRAWHHGDRLPSAYCADRYIVRDYRALRLSPPPRGFYWVRVDNDVLLTAVATGLVAQAVYGVF